MVVEGAPRSKGYRLNNGRRSAYRFVYVGKGDYECRRVTDRYRRYIRWGTKNSEGTGFPYIEGASTSLLLRTSQEGSVCSPSRRNPDNGRGNDR